MALLAPVHLDNVLGVDGQVFVRVYDHTEEARVGLKEEDKQPQLPIIPNKQNT